MSNELVLSAQVIVQKRLQGLSFNQIADEYGLTKSAIYYFFMEQKGKQFGGYMPIPVEELKEHLASDAPLYSIASKYNVPITGLQNYITDYSIPPRLNDETLRQKMQTMKVRELCDYFGASRSCIEHALKRLQ